MGNAVTRLFLRTNQTCESGQYRKYDFDRFDLSLERRVKFSYRVAHTMPRRTISRASGTSKSLSTCPSEQ